MTVNPQLRVSPHLSNLDVVGVLEGGGQLLPGGGHGLAVAAPRGEELHKVGACVVEGRGGVWQTAEAHGARARLNQVMVRLQMLIVTSRPRWAAQRVATCSHVGLEVQCGELVHSLFGLGGLWWLLFRLGLLVDARKMHFEQTALASRCEELKSNDRLTSGSSWSFFSIQVSSDSRSLAPWYLMASWSGLNSFNLHRNAAVRDCWINSQKASEAVPKPRQRYTFLQPL